jgi:hypothetical protein
VFTFNFARQDCEKRAVRLHIERLLGVYVDRGRKMLELIRSGSRNNQVDSGRAKLPSINTSNAMGNYVAMDRKQHMELRKFKEILQRQIDERRLR